ncbi:hypothetical protein [Cupriavidus alkaliphilus]|uniref:Uncharacterized protein n=1 Tax=Cupriavidus alkaliphilus TaxID=942866 RepID=A0A7W4VFK5_9BURK|nr:hypothetical protein [Cupriavidus alkaliphilus]MBB3010685.1 hypothetical protein [Cupriavidus alkaliphilus]
MSAQEKPTAMMRNGLRHRWGADEQEFFALVDATGGWPVGYPYVGFAHSDSRAAGFTMQPIHHGWWTTLYSADDYYLWKLSPAALQRIADAVHERIRVPRVDAKVLTIKNWRGHTAAIAKETGSAA